MISSDNSGRSSAQFQLRSRTPESAVCERIYNDYGEELFTAGQVVSAGTYLEVDSVRQVTLELSGPLPASLNGRRTYYSRLERPWAIGFITHPVATACN
ncbi:MAG: hypothetical protein WCS37_07340 [Chloroflexota bacterium]|nr:hypothetical protein [Chloroflexota bacterium]